MSPRTQRTLLLLLPALLAAASLVTLVSAPLAWGAAAPYGMPAWITTASGLGFAAAGLLIGALTFRSAWRRTTGEFHIFPFQLIAGSGLLLFATGCELYLAARLQVRSAYASLVDGNGKQLVTPFEFGLYTLFGLLLASFVVWAVAYLYTQAISDQRLTGVARRPPDEPDAIGEILASR